MIKQFIKRAFPKTFVLLRTTKDQLVIEYHTLRRVGITRIIKRFFPSKLDWKNKLPLQSINTISCDVDFQNLECLQGAHTYYLTPDQWEKSPLKHLQKNYPEGCGLKITKNVGGIDEPFSDPKKTGLSHTVFAPSHKELILTHNFFDVLGMGGRLYDAIDLDNKGKKHVGYVLEHIEGNVTTAEKCQAFVNKLKDLEKKQYIKLIFWTGYSQTKDRDFECPSCNGNLLEDQKTGTLKYIDLQHFAIENYTKYLEEVAKKAASVSHFGPESYLMGGKYLYQELPGLNQGGMRSPEIRFQVIKNVLKEANVNLKDQLVIDVGCNLGIIGGYYLQEGASWVHGIDTPEMVVASEMVMKALGCTRFSLTGIWLQKNTDLLSLLPKHINVEGCIISYLAIRNLLGGWLEGFAKLPWSFMIYESHQDESKEKNMEFFAELNKLKPCKVIAEAEVSDANSNPRYVAILKAIT